jgi:AraC-like DNA-binding protein
MAGVALRAFRDVRRGEVDIESAPLGMLLVIAVGDAYQVGLGDDVPARSVGGFAVGPQSRHGSSALTGTAEGVQVDLSWSSAAMIFGSQLAELADRVVPIRDLPGGERLLDRMEAATVQQRIGLVRDWLRARTGSRQAPAPSATRALRLIEGGQSSVRELAVELGCSRGHLHRTVRTLTGQSPSTLMRVARLHRLLSLPAASNLADLAAVGGYADHAHLCHETRHLAGRTPSELFGRPPEPDDLTTSRVTSHAVASSHSGRAAVDETRSV